MNVRLLRKIQKQILKEPRQFEMSYWFTRGPNIPNCGTAACIAGWAACLTKKLSPLQAATKITAPWVTGRHALRINQLQANLLFGQFSWPPKFRERILEARTKKQEARVAVARIDHFIKTKGAE